MRRKLMGGMLLGAAIISSQALRAEVWHATVGAQSADKGVQVLAFLPSEMWIHPGDSITWTFASNEAHSVTFLKVGQVRPTFATGCPGASLPNGTTPDGSATSDCVNSGLISTPGTTYTVVFPSTGNYTLVCLLHVNQTGIIHVLDSSQPLPHDQDFYDRQASIEQRDLISDRDGGLHRKFREDVSDHANGRAHDHTVVTGTGELVSSPGGIQSVSLMRFMQHSVTIHTGETVEWDSSDVSGHSVTFGNEEGITPLTPRSSNVFTDQDGALHAFISSTADNVHSGRIAPAPQERTNLQSVPGVTRFRVTFTQPGIYPYVCAFHDELGMKGEVIVLP